MGWRNSVASADRAVSWATRGSGRSPAGGADPAGHAGPRVMRGGQIVAGRATSGVAKHRMMAR